MEAEKCFSKLFVPLDLKKYSGWSSTLISRLYITPFCYRIYPSLKLWVLTFKEQGCCEWNNPGERISFSICPSIFFPGVQLSNNHLPLRITGFPPRSLTGFMLQGPNLPGFWGLNDSSPVNKQTLWRLLQNAQLTYVR